MINEIRGIGVAAAIGLGTGFVLGFIVSLAQNGLNSNSIKYAFAAGSRQGGAGSLVSASGAALGELTHGATESLSEMVMSQWNTSISTETARNISTMCKMGVVGSLTILAFSVYNFVKLKQEGFSTKESLLRTGRSAVSSFSLLFISIVVQGIWGGGVGMVVSIVAGVIVTGYVVGKAKHDKMISRDILYYSIDLSQPSFA